MGVLLALLIANLLSIITFYILKRKKIYSNKGLAMALWSCMVILLIIFPVQVSKSNQQKAYLLEVEQLIAIPVTSNYQDRINKLETYKTLIVDTSIQNKINEEINKLSFLAYEENKASLLTEAKNIYDKNPTLNRMELEDRIDRLKNIRLLLKEPEIRDDIDHLIDGLITKNNSFTWEYAKSCYGYKPNWNSDSKVDEIKSELQMARNVITSDEPKRTDIENEIKRLDAAYDKAVQDHEAKLEQERIAKFLNAPAHSYGELLRYPEEYTGKEIRRKGEVTQIAGDRIYRVNTKQGSWGYSGDDLFIFLPRTGEVGKINLIEDDIIDFAGTISEPISYKTVLGSERTIPAVYVEWVKILEVRN